MKPLPFGARLFLAAVLGYGLGTALNGCAGADVGGILRTLDKVLYLGCGAYDVARPMVQTLAGDGGVR